MAATAEVKRCKYCWRPADCPPGPVMTLNRFHNKGCPQSCDALPSAMAEWEEGYDFGFDDNYIKPWRYRNFSVTFLMGYRVGKAEIDRLVDEAVQSRYFE